MPAYIIVRAEVTDWPRYKEYMKLTPGAIALFGGKFIARGGEIATLEGPQENRRVVILEFPSLEQAKAFQLSDEYAQAKRLRAGAATVEIIAVDGCAT